MTAITAATCLRKAEGLPQDTPEFRMVRELIADLTTLANKDKDTK